MHDLVPTLRAPRGADTEVPGWPDLRVLINAVSVGRSGPVAVSGAPGALCSTNPG
jgi:hypothetical protein